jgi:hypothetical protein
MAGASQYTAADYTYYHPKALKGMLFGVEHGNEDITTISTVPIEYGQALAYAGGSDTTGRPTVKLPNAATDLILGVAVLRHRTPTVNGEANFFYEAADSLSTNYPAKYSVPARKVGKIYVYSETPVDLTLPVHVRYAPGAGVLQLGNFRAVAVAGETFALTGARWFEKTTAPGLAILDLNLPG